MSGSGRKRISKWDLQDAPQPSSEDIENNAVPGGEAGKLVQNKESQPGWHSPEFAGTNDPKWYGAEANNGGEVLDASMPMPWDADVSHNIKMSPGLDDWKQQKRNRSPKSGLGRSNRSRSRSQSRSQSRSRSRSPPRDFNRDSKSNDRSSAPQPCKDFAAGRCRRGENCPYLHQYDKNSEDRRYSGGGLTGSWEGRPRRDDASRYTVSDDTREHPLQIGRSNNLCNNFLKGRCFRGESCRYSHHSAVSDDGIGKGSSDESFNARENDRRNRMNNEPRRSGDIPCKFFAAGNCRNGKSCRFSHHGQTRDSPGDWPRDDSRRRGNNLSNVDQVREGSNWKDTNVPDVAKLPKWNEDRNGNVGVPEERAAAWSMDDKWEPNLESDSRSRVHPMESDRAKESNKSGYHLLKEENTGAGMEVSESKGAETWDGDMEISPPRDYRLPSSNNSFKEDPAQLNLTSRSQTRNEIAKHLTVESVQPLISQHSSFQMKPSSGKDTAAASFLDDRKGIRYSAMSGIDLNFSANVPSRQSLDQNHQSSSAFGLNAIGQNQQAFAAPYAPTQEFNPNTQSQPLFPDGSRSFNTAPGVADAMKSKEVTSEIPSSQNTVSREQLSQLTNLSASLAQLFGSGQQLPQLYAALNGSNSVGPVASAAASSQPNQAIVSQKQYDPLSDSVDLNKPDTSKQPPAGFAPTSVEQKPEIPSQTLVSGGASDGDRSRTAVELNNKSHQSNRATDPVAENVEMPSNENKKGKDSGPVEKIDGDGDGNGRGDEGKNGKGIRAFKFALVEFVKELLKPTWKEGQLSKEDHKTIVKKVVDKVTGSIQGVHIPQSQEKIDNYLSSSKPKLSKLVQAYVEKYQKS